MPIVTRSSGLHYPPHTHDLITQDDSFTPVTKPTPASTKTRRSMAPKLTAKDSNLIIDIAAPLPAFQSPFKQTKRASTSAARLSALKAKVTTLVTNSSEADKENRITEEDESDRAWEELNQPTPRMFEEVLVTKTPSAATKRKTRASARFQAPVTEIFTEEELSDVAATPYKLASSSQMPLSTPMTHSLTPNPCGTQQRRRLSTRGTALKVVDTNVGEDDGFGFGTGVIANDFEDDDEADAAEAMDSVATPQQSFTPASYGRTRSAFSKPTPTSSTSQLKRSDRRSLHHTQLQLLKQIVQEEEKQNAAAAQATVTEECDEQQEETKEDTELPSLPMIQPTLVKAGVSATSARKSRPSVAPSSSRKSFFETSSFVFHGVTPPSTIVKNKKMTILNDNETVPLPIVPATPVMSSEPQARIVAITPRSNSRRKSFQQREVESEVEVEPMEAEALPVSFIDAPVDDEIPVAMDEAEVEPVVEQIAQEVSAESMMEVISASTATPSSKSNRSSRKSTPLPPTPQTPLVSATSGKKSSRHSTPSILMPSPMMVTATTLGGVTVSAPPNTPMTRTSLAPVTAVVFDDDEVMSEIVEDSCVDLSAKKTSRKSTPLKSSTKASSAKASPKQSPLRGTPRSLVGVIAESFISPTKTIPDEILQMLFKRPYLSQVQVEEEEVKEKVYEPLEEVEVNEDDLVDYENDFVEQAEDVNDESQQLEDEEVGAVQEPAVEAVQVADEVQADAEVKDEVETIHVEEEKPFEQELDQMIQNHSKSSPSPSATPSRTSTPSFSTSTPSSTSSAPAISSPSATFFENQFRVPTPLKSTKKAIAAAVEEAVVMTASSAAPQLVATASTKSRRKSLRASANAAAAASTVPASTRKASVFESSSFTFHGVVPLKTEDGNTTVESSTQSRPRSSSGVSNSSSSSSSICSNPHVKESTLSTSIFTPFTQSFAQTTPLEWVIFTFVFLAVLAALVYAF